MSALAKDPVEPRVYFLAGRLARLRGERNRAAAFYREARKYGSPTEQAHADRQLAEIEALETLIGQGLLTADDVATQSAQSDSERSVHLGTLETPKPA